MDRLYFQVRKDVIYDHEFDTSEEFIGNDRQNYQGNVMSANKSSKRIVVIPYNPDWPKMFEAESQKIKEALGDNCIAIHHSRNKIVWTVLP